MDHFSKLVVISLVELIQHPTTMCNTSGGAHTPSLETLLTKKVNNIEIENWWPATADTNTF